MPQIFVDVVTQLERSVGDGGHNRYLLCLKVKRLDGCEDNEHSNQERDDGAEYIIQIESRRAGRPDRGHEREHTVADKDARHIERGLCEQETNARTGNVRVLNKVAEGEYEFVIQNKGHESMCGGGSTQYNNFIGYTGPQ